MVVRIVDSYARSEVSKIIELATVERQVGCAVRPHNHAKRGVLGLQQWLCALHFDGCWALATRMTTFTSACWLIDLQHNALLHRRTKARGRSRDVVGAGGEIRDVVVAGRGADGLLAASSTRRRDGDGGAGNDNAAALRHRSFNRGVNGLCA
jgi:hypothetical protein